jgi:hypothetical protein
VQDPEAYLPNELRAALRAPVTVSAGARARVMHRVREAAEAMRRSGMNGPSIVAIRSARHPRGSVRPALLGALLAASFVAAVVSAGGRAAAGERGRTTLADTIAMSFEPPPEPQQPPVIDPRRIVAVADETSQPALSPAIQTRK